MRVPHWLSRLTTFNSWLKPKPGIIVSMRHRMLRYCKLGDVLYLALQFWRMVFKLYVTMRDFRWTNSINIWPRGPIKERVRHGAYLSQEKSSYISLARFLAENVMFGGFGPNFDRKQLRAAKRFPCGVLAHSDSRAPRGERWMGQVICWAKGAWRAHFVLVS
jgi:hypothetical protein